MLGWLALGGGVARFFVGDVSGMEEVYVSGAFAAGVVVLALVQRLSRRYSALTMCLFIMVTFAVISPFYPDMLQGAYLGLSLVFALFSILLVDNWAAWMVAVVFAVVWAGAEFYAGFGVSFLVAMISVLAVLAFGVVVLGRIKEVLLGSEARYRALWESVPVGLVASDVNGLLLDMNDAQLRAIGAETSEDVFGFPASSFWANPDQRYEVMTTLATEGVVSAVEVEAVRLDGTRYWCRLYGTQIVDTEGRVVNHFVVDDVSDEHAALEALEEVVRLKDRFLASVSHELRTPLTVIVGLASEIREYADTLSAAEILEFISIIADQSDELAMLVEDLLVATRMEVGEVAIYREDIDLAGLIDRTVGQTTEADSVVVERTGTARAYADPLRVRQIIRNLVVNARRAGAAHVEVRIERHTEHVAVLVIDDGPGVPEGVDMFEPYVTVGSQQGTDPLGLGLFVSRSLARRMDGDLTYCRESDRTWFTLELPPGRTVSTMNTSRVSDL